jgi:hypothetical protein
MAKLESLVVGNEPATQVIENTDTPVSDNKLATPAADTQTAVIQ